MNNHQRRQMMNQILSEVEARVFHLERKKKYANIQAIHSEWFGMYSEEIEPQEIISINDLTS